MTTTPAENPLTWADLAAASGSGVEALILDSGVESSHPAFAGRSIATWRVQVEENGTRRVVTHDGVDVFGHGTACCSILLENAPNATVQSVAVIDERGGWSDHVLAALHWGIDRGFGVINCSFTTAQMQYLAEYKSVIDRAFCRNVWIVSACNNSAFWRVEFPGSFPTVLSTDFAAMDPLRLRHRRGELVEFVARGQDIRVPWKGGSYRVMTGSSLAAPQLAAIACRLRELRPDWNICEAKSALYKLAAQNDVGRDLSRQAPPAG